MKTRTEFNLGSVTTSSARVAIIAIALLVYQTFLAAQIFQPPSLTASQQPTNIARPLGLAAAMSVSASGSEPLIFQWSRNGSTIPAATDSSLRISEVNAITSGMYSCEVTNHAGRLEVPFQLSILPVQMIPQISWVHVPDIGVRDWVTVAITNGNVDDFDLVPWDYVLGTYWSKPYERWPRAEPDTNNNTYRWPYWTGGVDGGSPQLVAALVPKGTDVPVSLGTYELPDVVYDTALCISTITRQLPVNPTVQLEPLSDSTLRISVSSGGVDGVPYAVEQSSSLTAADWSVVPNTRAYCLCGVWQSIFPEPDAKAVYYRLRYDP